MPYTELLLMMRNLKLYGMAESLAEAYREPDFNRLSKELLLSNLMKAEIADRRARSINYQMGIAKFPVYRDLDNFDFTSSEASEEQIRTLHEGAFIPERRNVIFVGGTGSGKTHLAIAIARQAIKNMLRARFFNVVDLVNKLESKKLAGNAGKLAE